MRRVSMAKKYVVGKNSLFTMDSSLRKLKTEFEDQMLMLTRGNIAGNVREKVMGIDYKVLRRIGERLSIVSIIINTREMQIMPFLSPATDIGAPGFVICKKGGFGRKALKTPDSKSKQLVEMVEQTGFVYDPLREDDFMDFGKMFVRELLTIDQVAVELQRNKKGEVGAFWLVDGGSIFRATEEGYEDNPKNAFVQEIEGQVVAIYTREDIIFDYMFKRADLVHRGYGYSLLEQSVDLITTLILGISYNRDIFTKEKIPKGFIALQGEADRETIEAVERYWFMAMSGAGARFRIPIIPSGKEGVSLDFKTLGQSNRDMEYYKLMNFFLSLFAGVFSMDLAELGIKTDMTQQSLGENIEGRVKYSKDRGVEALLTFLSGFMNKIIRKIDEEYEFRFVGVSPEDEEKKYKIHKAAIESTRSINDMLEEDGFDKREGEEYDIPLNQNFIQLRAQIKDGQQQEEGGEEYEEGEYEEEGEEEAGEEEAEEEVTKSQEALEKHLDTLIKAGYDVEIEI